LCLEQRLATLFSTPVEHHSPLAALMCLEQRLATLFSTVHCFEEVADFG